MGKSLYRSWCYDVLRQTIPPKDYVQDDGIVDTLQQLEDESEESWTQRFNQHIRQCSYCSGIAVVKFPGRYAEAMGWETK